MSYCKTYGKDKVIFVTKEDHAEKSKIVLSVSEPQPGLLLPSGEINWNCPCLGGMATGPCGVEFRDAFSCFHYSEAEPKGSDCYDTFKTMQVRRQLFCKLIRTPLLINYVFITGLHATISNCLQSERW